MPYKNTDKNNKKRIKTIISLLIKRTKTQMNSHKIFINKLNQSEKSRIRYKKSRHHVHDFKSKQIISKNLGMYLNINDSGDTVFVVHPTMEINLMDYLDVIEHKGYLFFSLKQIFDLIKDVKYVLFVDMSCSGAEGNLNNNVILNNFKAKAEEIEGPSITNNMVLNLHESPYNTSPLGLDPANFNPATNAANGRANGRQKRTKKNNVQLPANNSEL